MILLAHAMEFMFGVLFENENKWSKASLTKKIHVK